MLIAVRFSSLSHLEPKAVIMKTLLTPQLTKTKTYVHGIAIYLLERCKSSRKRVSSSSALRPFLFYVSTLLKAIYFAGSTNQGKLPTLGV